MNTDSDFFVDKNAEAFDKTIDISSDKKINENLDAIKANSESYTYRLDDLKYLLDNNNKIKRNIDANEVSDANKSDNFDKMEDLTTTNFNGVTSTSLIVTNGKSKLESNETIKSEVKKTEKPIDEVADIDDLLLEKDTESKQLVGKEIKINSALDYLKRLFPTESEDVFKFLEAVRSGDKNVFGRFVNGIIEVEKASSDTVYENIVRHEAFHKVWNEFLTQEQRNSIVESYLNTLTEQQEKEQGLFGLPLEQLSKILEEKIARKYQAYNKNQDKNYGFMQKSLLYLKDVFSRLKTMLTGRASDIEHYFNLIDGGYFNSQFANFRGTRGYYGIQEDFGTVDNYIIAKQKVADIFAHISSLGRNGSFIPFSETEINDSLLATVKSLLAKTNNIVSKMDVKNLSEQDKINYNKYLKNIEAYESLLRTNNGTRFPVLVKMLNEILPGRSENSIINNN
jgi:ASC-1-like (ASCH) protein